MKGTETLGFTLSTVIKLENSYYQTEIWQEVQTPNVSIFCSDASQDNTET